MSCSLKSCVSPSKRGTIYGAVLLAVAALLWRFAFLLTGQGVIDGDEGVVGIMTNRLLHEGDVSVYFAGQHYLGTAEVWIAALVSAFAGEANPLTLKITAALISLFYAGTLGLLIRVASGSRRAGWIAAVLALFGPALLTYWGMKTRGGFLLTCALGNLILYQTWSLSRSCDSPELSRRACVLGILAGFAFYTYALVVPFFVASGFWFLAMPSRGRRVFFEDFRRRPLAAGLALAVSLVALCAAASQTLLSDFVLPLEARRVLLVLCLLTLAVLAGLPYLRSRAPGLPALFGVCFLVGMAPALVYLWHTPAPWYMGAMRLTHRELVVASHFLLSDFPILTTARDPAFWNGSIPVRMVPVLMIWVAVLLLPLRGRGRAPDTLARRTARFLWVLLAASAFFSITSGTAGFEPRHMLPGYTAILGLAALFLDGLARVSRVSAAVILLGIVGMNAWFTFRPSGPEYVWPRYVETEYARAGEVLEHAGIRHVRAPMRPVFYEFPFSLGAEYRLSTMKGYDRFPDYKAEVLGARYAIADFADAEEPESLRVENPDAWERVPFESFTLFLPPVPESEGP